MKTRFLLAAACLALPCAAALAQTQSTQHYEFPAAPGSLSPPSTLTITQEGGTPAASGIIHDTPESLAEYQRCRTVSDRAAITNADRQNGVMQCLKALQERRRQGAVLP